MKKLLPILLIVVLLLCLLVSCVRAPAAPTPEPTETAAATPEPTPVPTPEPEAERREFVLESEPAEEPVTESKEIVPEPESAEEPVAESEEFVLEPDPAEEPVTEGKEIVPEPESAEEPMTESGEAVEAETAPEAAPEAEPVFAEESAEAAEEPAFAELIEGQAFAVAMAFHEGHYLNGVTPSDPDFLWDATGWYVAWLYRTKMVNMLTEDEVRDFQRSLGNRDEDAMSVEWLEAVHGVSVQRSSDGTVYYSFPDHIARMEALLGQTLEFFLEADEEPTAVAALRQHYAENSAVERRYELSFMRNRAPYSSFAYSLRNAVVPDSGPAMDAALDFDWDGLIAANSLKNILSIYPAVKIRNTYDDGMPVWIFERDGNLCILRGNENYGFGQYRGCWFEYQRCADGKMRAVVSAFGPEAGNPEACDNYISEYLEGAAIILLDSVDDDLIRTHFTFVGDWLQDVAFDRGTLVLREMSHRIDESFEPILNTFTYDEEPPAFSFLDGWDRPLRHLTLVWEDWYEGGPSVRRETVELPADWEYVPAEGRWGDYTIYMNEGYTRPYFYPGDNIDYTLYLTTAKG